MTSRGDGGSQAMPDRRARHRGVAWPVVAALLAATACGDQGPPVSGTYTVEIASPHGAEGAARVTLVGEGVRAVSAVDGWVFEELGDTLTTVLVVNDEPGPLRFRVEVADTTTSLGGTVTEVAGPDDALRGSLSAYTVRVVR